LTLKLLAVVSPDVSHQVAAAARHIRLILMYRLMSGRLTTTNAAAAISATLPTIDQMPMPDDFLSLLTKD